MVFGGINETFIHAFVTEDFLVGKSLNDQNVLSQAFSLMSSEIQPNTDPVMASSDYRRSLALSLFYKFILYVNQNKISPRNQSALTSVIDSRPLSTGTQSYPTQPSNYPLTQPIPKLNSKLQVNYQLRIFQMLYDFYFIKSISYKN